MIAVEELLHTHPFVRLVMQAKDKVPCVVLYTDEQLQDIRRLCCTAPHGQTTVLGFDKTYNLGDIHVTVSIFKNLSVLRTTTGDHPIFAGPMFLHGNSDYDTYRHFFQHLASKLENCTSKPVTGTDQEKAMCKGVEAAFPSAGHLVCTRHMRGNVEDYLHDVVGVAESDRVIVSDAILGENGLAHATESSLFTVGSRGIQKLCTGIRTAL